MSIETPLLDPHPLRAQFPALRLEVNGGTAVYLDGPGGTQSPQRVIDAMADYLSYGNSNHGGPFLTSRHADEVHEDARKAIADLLNAARPEEIAFGQNMTSMTMSLSRSLARDWKPGDEIIVTRLDHDGNISPWLLAAEDHGVTVRWLDFHPEDCTLALETLPDLLNEKTRLLAITHASNAVGTIVDVKDAVSKAHSAGALVYVDAVHYAPHGLIDAQDLDCDFLACSTYKFFGPHTGVLYCKYEHSDRLTAYKVRPAPSLPPGKWETGTQSFESLAGVTEAVEYIASVGGATGSRRERIAASMAKTKAYEMALSERFLAAAAAIPGLEVYGLTDTARLAERTPTFAVSLDGYSPAEVAANLGDQGIFVWDGHYYAVAVMERLGVLDKGGLVRIGFAHYNTFDELERLFEALESMVK